MSECIYGVSAQYAYTQLGYVEDQYLVCLRGIRIDMECEDIKIKYISDSYILSMLAAPI